MKNGFYRAILLGPSCTTLWAKKACSLPLLLGFPNNLFGPSADHQDPFDLYDPSRATAMHSSGTDSAYCPAMDNGVDVTKDCQMHRGPLVQSNKIISSHVGGFLR